MRVRQNPRCRCGKYLADFGRIHADETPACDIWRKVQWPHAVTGPYEVYSDGDGHYAVIGPDRKIIHYGIAADYANMKAIEANSAR